MAVCGRLQTFRSTATASWRVVESVREFSGATKMADSANNVCDCLFVCVEVLRPSQPNEVMSSAVILPNHTFTGQA